MSSTLTAEELLKMQRQLEDRSFTVKAGTGVGNIYKGVTETIGNAFESTKEFFGITNDADVLTKVDSEVTKGIDAQKIIDKGLGKKTDALADVSIHIQDAKGNIFKAEAVNEDIIMASAFALEGFIWAIGVALLVGLAWIVSTRWGWQRGSTLSMFCFMLGISGAALQENIYRGLLLTSTIATLAAWDLSSFARLLEIHQNIASKEDLIRIFNHLDLKYANHPKNFWVVEIADGIIQRETRILLESEEVRSRIYKLIFCANDSEGESVIGTTIDE